jgi:hypothetical protein
MPSKPCSLGQVSRFRQDVPPSPLLRLPASQQGRVPSNVGRASLRPGSGSWPALPLPWRLSRRQTQVLVRLRRVLRSRQGSSRIAKAQGKRRADVLSIIAQSAKRSDMGDR